MQAKPTLGELWSLSCEAGSVERERSELRNLPCETRSAERESKGTKATNDKDSFMNYLHMIPRVPLSFWKNTDKVFHWPEMVYFKINFRIKYLFHPISSTFKQLSIQSSFMSRSHMISKVLHISAFFLANITMENLPSWTVFTWTPRCHLLHESLLHTSH